MPQIINEGPSIGALFGQGLGQGFGTGLERLAQHKLNQVLQRQQSEQTSRGLAALGIPEQQAQQIAMLPPELQSVVVKNYLQGAESAGLDQALQGILGTGAQEVQQEEQNGLQELRQQQATQQVPQQRKLELTGKDALLNAIEEIQGKKQPQAEPGSTALGKPKVNSFQEALLKPRLKPEHKLKVAELQSKNQQANRKLNHDYITKVYNTDRAAQQEDKVLKRIIAIREGGKARPAAMTQALKELGIDYQALKNNDTLELEKLGTWFLQGAPDLFGGKVSNQQMQIRLRQVPNDLQTDEGSTLLANQMLLANESKHAEARAIREIIKENGGEPPWDLQIKAAERAQKIQEDLASKFINGEPAFTTKKSSDTFETLPDAAKYKGRVVEDERTGQRLRSDGTRWIKV
jgi:hypothetical protein